jgi:hypothetical protein
MVHYRTTSHFIRRRCYQFLWRNELSKSFLSFVTLGIAVFFLFFGSGKNSADYYFKMEK